MQVTECCVHICGASAMATRMTMTAAAAMARAAVALNSGAKMEMTPSRAHH